MMAVCTYMHFMDKIHSRFCTCVIYVKYLPENVQ